MPAEATSPRSPYSRSMSMPARSLNRPESTGSPRTPRTARDSPRSGAVTPQTRDLPSTATVDLSEADEATLRTMYEDVTIASRFRTKPSAVELMAHALPGRNTYSDKVEWGKDTKLRNQVQLSSYPDCIGGNLSNLRSFTDRYLSGVVGGVHVLPFYPSSADRGFAPLTYKEVSPEFGAWEDIDNMGDGLDLCMDFMVNHISAQSEQFKDFKEKGDASEWAELFIRYNKFWGGEPTEDDLDLIYTRKPRPPFLEVEHADGTSQKVWCTFDYEQVDIDAFSPLGNKFIEDQLASLCEHGCSLIRLDAFGYTTKKKGTNCFFVVPEVWELLDRCNAMLKKRGTELLCEVHEHFSMQKTLAEKGFWVYDFALPMLTLQALYDGDANNIKAWWLKCPRNQITTLDTHDGLGVVDVADLMSQDQIDRTKANIFSKGANANMRFNTKEYGNLDIYQINCSYYSAVGDQDDWYVLARAIQFFTPGIPLVYYVGLLAGKNDLDLVEATKVGRDINRHGYDLEEAVSECDRPVVKVLFELCRFRNHHPAFNGTFELLDTIPDIKESTVLLPPTAYTPAPQSPLPGAISPIASMDSMTEGPPGASGSFAAQTVSLLASLDGEEQDFLADIVLEKASIDCLASVDPGDAAFDSSDWEVDHIVASCMEDHSAALEGAGRPATIPEDSLLKDGSEASSEETAPTAPAKAPEPETEDEPVKTREDPVEESVPKTEAEVTERLTNLAAKKKIDRIPLVDSSQHLDVRDQDALVMSEADLPFQPFSAALKNLKDKDSLMSPAALASGDPNMMTPLQQVRMVRMASRRDPEHDLPNNVLCCKWTNGDNWAVMEANLHSKDLRILYVDPFDGRQKVWAVTRSLHVYKDQQAASTPPSPIAQTPGPKAADAA